MKNIIMIITLLLTLNGLFIHTVFSEDMPVPPDLSSEAAIVMEADTGVILFEKNSRTPMYPASITKIATAIYAIENGDLDDIVTVSSKARNTEGTRVYLEEGEQVTLQKLLQGLLVNSGNDAGMAVAEHLSGGVELFSSDLNEYLKNIIGIHDTNFENPHGLFNAEHVTTAEDMAKITQYAMKNEFFMDLFGTKEIEWNGDSWDTTLYTHHKLLRETPYEGVTGGKNGFVPQAGSTLVTTAKRENLNLIVVTLKSASESEAYKDTIKLLDYGFENFVTTTLTTDKSLSASVPEYLIPPEVTYTHPTAEQLSIDIKENGMLELVNLEGAVIYSFQLPRMNGSETSELSINEEKPEPGTKSVFSIFSYLSIAIVILASLFYYRRRKIS